MSLFSGSVSSLPADQLDAQFNVLYEQVATPNSLYVNAPMFVLGGVSASYFVGDGSQIKNLASASYAVSGGTGIGRTNPLLSVTKPSPLTANWALNATGSSFVFLLSPNAFVTATLPSHVAGQNYPIKNVALSCSLCITSAGTVITTLVPGAFALIVDDGTTWQLM